MVGRTRLNVTLYVCCLSCLSSVGFGSYSMESIVRLTSQLRKKKKYFQCVAPELQVF